MPHPNPGDVVDGYTFQGGDPNKPEAWKPLAGDAFLKTLQPQTAAQVHALAVGAMPFPGGFALKSPYWQKMISAVAQYDPSFDAVNYGARFGTRKDFTSGKSAQTLNALNTALGHLDALDKAGDALKNGEFKPLNWAKNTLSPQFGYPEVGNFDADAGLVSEELTRAYRGSGGNESDIKRLIDALSHNASPEQRRGALNQMAVLLQSKIKALGDQYNQGMGTTKDPLKLLSPHSADTFNRLLSYGAEGGEGVPQKSPETKATNVDDLLKKYGAQ